MSNLKNVLTLFVSLSTLPAMASYNGPFVIKSSNSGFTPPEWTFSETCKVFSDRVEIRHFYGAGALAAKEVRKLTISGSQNLAALVELAAAEPLDLSENDLCDAPATVISGIRVLPNDATESVKLFSTGGCGTSRAMRTGPYANMLRDFVNQFCQKNFDYRQ